VQDGNEKLKAPVEAKDSQSLYFFRSCRGFSLFLLLVYSHGWRRGLRAFRPRTGLETARIHLQFGAAFGKPHLLVIILL
jgi:hypothetical protein